MSFNRHSDSSSKLPRQCNRPGPTGSRVAHARSRQRGSSARGPAGERAGAPRAAPCPNCARMSAGPQSRSAGKSSKSRASTITVVSGKNQCRSEAKRVGSRHGCGGVTLRKKPSSDEGRSGAVCYPPASEISPVGNQNRMRVPFSGALSATMRPPCSSTRARQI